jgi:hypothetical protein
MFPLATGPLSTAPLSGPVFFMREHVAEDLGQNRLATLLSGNRYRTHVTAQLRTGTKSRRCRKALP